MKYILKQIDDISGSNAVTTIEFSTDTLDSVLGHVDLFIRGCGFFPPAGVLDYVDDDIADDFVGWDNNWDLKTEDVEHDESYFDTERNK